MIICSYSQRCGGKQPSVIHGDSKSPQLGWRSRKQRLSLVAELQRLTGHLLLVGTRQYLLQGHLCSLQLRNTQNITSCDLIEMKMKLFQIWAADKTCWSDLDMDPSFAGHWPQHEPWRTGECARLPRGVSAKGLNIRVFIVMGVPQMVGLKGKNLLKWMMTGGSPF